ncbi:unnamed protein product [Lymnaea stagnalis]|uniref:Nitric oxide synthase-interacting protein zinc-finger domain-containing protein n=1 Tax=Lymnaea stagnalis TaxID=6523 RepID=A0AAV2INA6_LYMST
MTRHGRNCTAGTVYTYHERKKDTQASGFGSQKVRYGKDAVKEFDCCCLTLQPCKEPLVTDDGHIYDKEAILKNIIHQKKEIARKLKEYEKQKSRSQKELEEIAKAEQETKALRFAQQESNPIGQKYANDSLKEKHGAGKLVQFYRCLPDVEFLKLEKLAAGMRPVYVKSTHRTRMTDDHLKAMLQIGCSSSKPNNHDILKAKRQFHKSY